MKIFLVRHGETDWNKQMLVQGRIDNPLNLTGLEQAFQIRPFFANKQIDKIYSSSLSRAYTTAAIATMTTEIFFNDNFIERDFGKLEGESVENFFNTTNLNAIDGYEADSTIIQRIEKGIAQCYCETDESIAIFAHSHVLKAALTLIDSNKYNFKAKIKNCAIVEMDFDGKNLNLIQIH